MRRIPCITIRLPACPKCGSTDRADYYATKRRATRNDSGLVVSYVVERRTHCLRCGTKRRERCVEVPADAAQAD